MPYLGTSAAGARAALTNLTCEHGAVVFVVFAITENHLLQYMGLNFSQQLVTRYALEIANIVDMVSCVSLSLTL